MGEWWEGVGGEWGREWGNGGREWGNGGKKWRGGSGRRSGLEQGRTDRNGNKLTVLIVSEKKAIKAVEVLI